MAKRKDGFNPVFRVGGDKASVTHKGDKIKKMAQNTRAKQFELDVNKQEKQMLRERAHRVKSGGFSSEHDYFKNVNPFTGKRSEGKK